MKFCINSSLKVWPCFSRDFKDFIYVFVFQHFYCDVFGYGSFCIYLIWSSLSFLDVLINIFHQIWNVSIIISLIIFMLLYFLSSPLLSTPLLFYSFFHFHFFSYFAYVGGLNGMHISLILRIFLIFLSSCSSDCIIFIDLYSISQILSFASSNLLLSPSSELFVLVIVLFNSSVSICFLKQLLLFY